jgi:hypothetical protein
MKWIESDGYFVPYKEAGFADSKPYLMVLPMQYGTK